MARHDEGTGNGKTGLRNSGAATKAPGTNVAVVSGLIIRSPQERIAGDGQPILSFELRVRTVDGPVEVVPVAWPDHSLATTVLEAGTEVVVIGRVRQRFFRSGGTTQSRTELVAEAVIAARQLAAVRKALARAAARLVA